MLDFGEHQCKNITPEEEALLSKVLTVDCVGAPIHFSFVRTIENYDSALSYTH